MKAFLKKLFDKDLFTVADSEYKLNLFWLALPIFLENISVNLIGLLQTAMSSYYADGFFILVTSVPNQLLSVVYNILALAGAGLAIILSIHIGQHKTEDGGKLVGTALWTVIVLTVVLGAVSLVFADQFLVMMGLGVEEYTAQRPYAVLYFRLRVVALMVTFWSGIFTASLRCYGFPKISLFASLASNGLNVLLTFLAMFVVKVPPEQIVWYMGGITLVSSGINALVVCVYFKCKKLPFSFRFEKKYFKEIVCLGFPATVASIAYSVSQTVTGGLCVGLGEDVYKTKQYVSQIVYFAYVLGYSVGQANSIMLGRVFGMDDKERADKMHRQNLRIVIALNLIMSLAFTALCNPLMSLIFNANENILAYAQIIFYIDIAVEFGRGMNHVGQFGLNAVGDVRFTTIISIVSCWACSVGLSFLFVSVLNMGLPGMWTAFAVDEIFRGTWYYIRWRRGKWKNRVIE